LELLKGSKAATNLLTQTYEEVYMTGTKYTEQQVKRLEKFFSTIKTPEGYERTCEMPEVGKEYDSWADHDTGVLRVTGEDAAVVFRASFYKNKLSISGTTEFKDDGVWYSFDRRGIEDSFYMEQESAKVVKAKIKRWGIEGGWGYQAESNTNNGGQAMLEKQTKRAKDYMEGQKGKLTVPHYGHRISPERKEEIKKKILGRGHTFAPSGMGTAYHVSTRKTSRFDSTVPTEVANFFGIDRQLYASHQDWD